MKKTRLRLLALSALLALAACANSPLHSAMPVDSPPLGIETAPEADTASSQQVTTAEFEITEATGRRTVWKSVGIGARPYYEGTPLRNIAIDAVPKGDDYSVHVTLTGVELVAFTTGNPVPVEDDLAESDTERKDGAPDSAKVEMVDATAPTEGTVPAPRSTLQVPETTTYERYCRLTKGAACVIRDGDSVLVTVRWKK